jgi:hypothetical protein
VPFPFRYSLNPNIQADRADCVRASVAALELTRLVARHDGLEADDLHDDEPALAVAISEANGTKRPNRCSCSLILVAAGVPSA